MIFWLGFLMGVCWEHFRLVSAVTKSHSPDAYVPEDFELTPEMRRGIAEGVADFKAGRITPWEDVERELNLSGNGSR